jgi:hypothetical protein
MKRTVIAMAVGAISGLAALTSAQAQGVVQLDNYASSGNLISYNGSPLPGSSAYTVGLFWAAGNVVGSVPADPTGTAVPGGPLALGTGAGSTTPTTAPGYFSSTANFAMTGVAAGTAATFEIIAYNGASYAAATIRGHSAPFSLNAGANGGALVQVGLGMPAFSLFSTSVPEPTTMALAGLAGASLLLFRRRK